MIGKGRWVTGGSLSGSRRTFVSSRVRQMRPDRKLFLQVTGGKGAVDGDGVLGRISQT